METNDYLTHEPTIMSISTNFKKDFAILKKYFDIEYNMEFPELNFVYKSFREGGFNKANNTVTILGCTKIKFIFDMERNDRYVQAFPMIHVYLSVIASFVRQKGFINEQSVIIYFARMTLIHELVHYFQLSDKVFFSKILNTNDYDRFDNTLLPKVVDRLEYDCVSTVDKFIRKIYSSDAIMVELSHVEILDYNMVSGRMKIDEYNKSMSKSMMIIEELLG